ncbi:hypothetical protein NK6_486 [Bradyrhizobium diazoefficiens]|uniref:Uncharacterized protein n=1 Tax=Bradyrhizobium diazoefficiens TaxID=1355477 RepID=A0A0E4BJG8_9BRAD|nr:hypothetical protein NK6_486 [Bradyrhizobium diazoefficiens]
MRLIGLGAPRNCCRALRPHPEEPARRRPSRRMRRRETAYIE